MNRRTLEPALFLLLAACGADARTGAVPDVRESLVRVEPRPPGQDDLVLGDAGAAPAGARVALFDARSLEAPVAEGAAAADGSFGPLPIGDNAVGRLWARVEAEGLRRFLPLENDVRAPSVTLSSPEVEGRSAEVELACDEPPCTFECGVDGGIFQACTSPFSTGPLDHGVHALRVRALDAAGNRGGASSVWWDVAVPPPDVRIDGGPGPTETTTAARLRFSSSAAGATFECAEVPHRWRACTSPHEYFAYEGDVVFEVRAVLHGSRSEPAEWRWAVDTHGPTVNVGQQPGFSTNDPTPVFAWTCSEAPCETRCSLDGGDLFDCDSPLELGPLDDGDHQLDIHAWDVAGNEGWTRRQWKQDTIPPDVELLSAPAARVLPGELALDFRCTDATMCAFTCAVDGGEEAACEAPLVLAGLAEGPHEVRIRATDWLGNEGQQAVSTFTVDGTPPQLLLVETPESTTAARTATFVFTCGEPCETVCWLDDMDPEPCASPWSTGDLPAATHSLRITAVDGVGLEGEAAHEWTITE